MVFGMVCSPSPPVCNILGLFCFSMIAKMNHQKPPIKIFHFYRINCGFVFHSSVSFEESLLLAREDWTVLIAQWRKSLDGGALIKVQIAGQSTRV